MVITFDQEDHSDHIPHLERYLLMVSRIMGTTCLSKVLMDSGNIQHPLCQPQLDGNLGEHPSKAPFYRIVSGKEAMPLGTSS